MIERMAATKWVAFSSENAALCMLPGTKDSEMVELIFMAEQWRNPLQAFARRWYCKSLFRATRGQRRCPECTAS
jgi:hypothetical protein